MPLSSLFVDNLFFDIRYEFTRAFSRKRHQKEYETCRRNSNLGHKERIAVKMGLYK